ncbi:TIGR03086 family metal-binding protein [Nocardiopsis potens]|uniref:TIGR03086 family metal-binding protein n=1 Tax=Nocardiopsis potens TaxID=1246458 RepID=UPI000349A5CB|nr:TIGR03086 family metal-binding protein [Nocardiopsis potens]
MGGRTVQGGTIESGVGADPLAALTARDMAGDLLGPELLRQAVGLVLGAVQRVEPEMLAEPTPCPAWDLEMLLLHVADSLAAVEEGTGAGRVGLVPGPGAVEEEHGAVSAVRIRACRLLPPDRARRAGAAAVGDRSMGVAALAGVGALELAVHAWDIGQACRRPVRIPAALAAQLLDIAPLVVTDATRHRLFGPPVPTAPNAPVGDRLVARLGRTPSPLPG